MISVALVPSDNIQAAWFVAAPMLARSVEKSAGRSALDSILSDLLAGEQTLWLAFDGGVIIGCCTVRIVDYETGLRVLSYEHLAGKDVDRWLDEGHKVLQQYAKEYGCKRLEVPQGRKGWEPFLKAFGYRTYAVRYEFELKD